MVFLTLVGKDPGAQVENAGVHVGVGGVEARA